MRVTFLIARKRHLTKATEGGRETRREGGFAVAQLEGTASQGGKSEQREAVGLVAYTYR